jgi:DnaJ-class molecular chaperone
MDKTPSKFEIISQARITLDLPESATLDHIRNNYRKLIKQWHPDKHPSEPELAQKKTREIIHAHRVIMQYCNQYHYSFSRQEVEKYLSDRERWFKQFGCDPIWANENE